MASAKKSLADFKAAHDKSFIVPAKIKDGLEKLGKDGWEYESDFYKTSNVPPQDLAKFRQQFSDNVVIVKNNGKELRVWAGSVALAAKMREML